MNQKQRQTLVRIFEHPTRAEVRWNELESLMRALGAEQHEGAGSRVRLVLNGAILNLHRPHPKPEMKKYAVEEVRAFLTALGIEAKEN